jgi:hypothetical protein
VTAAALPFRACQHDAASLPAHTSNAAVPNASAAAAASAPASAATSAAPEPSAGAPVKLVAAPAGPRLEATPMRGPYAKLDDACAAWSKEACAELQDLGPGCSCKPTATTLAKATQTHPFLEIALLDGGMQHGGRVVGQLSLVPAVRFADGWYYADAAYGSDVVIGDDVSVVYTASYHGAHVEGVAGGPVVAQFEFESVSRELGDDVGASTWKPGPIRHHTADVIACGRPGTKAACLSLDGLRVVPKTPLSWKSVAIDPARTLGFAKGDQVEDPFSRGEHSRWAAPGKPLEGVVKILFP